MERSVETSLEPMTSVRREVAFVREQLAIEQERFHDRLRVSFDVPDNLLNERIPAFSLQPLAENAIRHGIGQSIDGGVIVVSVARKGTDLLLSVENTGSELSPGWREGTGLGNLRARLDARYGRKADLSIAQSGDRTRATIRIAQEESRLDGRQHLRMRGGRAAHRAEWNSAIKRHQRALHLLCESEQIDICDLPMAADQLRHKQFRIRQRDGVGPLMVLLVCAEPAEMFERFARADQSGVSRLLCGHSHKPVFRDRTGRPSVPPVIGEPVMGDFMMYMFGEKQRDEHVHVE